MVCLNLTQCLHGNGGSFLVSIGNVAVVVLCKNLLRGIPCFIRSFFLLRKIKLHSDMLLSLYFDFIQMQRYKLSWINNFWCQKTVIRSAILIAVLGRGYRKAHKNAALSVCPTLVLISLTPTPSICRNLNPQSPLHKSYLSNLRSKYLSKFWGHFTLVSTVFILFLFCIEHHDSSQHHHNTHNA